MNNVSLMMITFNRLNLTKRTIESIYKTVNVPFNFIIVDNNSTDGTVDYLKSLSSEKDNIKLILNSKNLGIAKGRNQALKLANDLKSEWFATVDNDVLLPSNWLNECINIMKNNPQYGCIGVNYEATNYPLIRLIGGFEIQNKTQGNLGTATMVISNKLHKMIGYFNDKDYSPFYGLEDSDFGMRARFAGFKLGYIKERGIHLGVDENDQGEYREFKTKEHDGNVHIFKQNCVKYANKNKSIYISYNE